MCDDGMYGVNCSKTCGACEDNEACHHINGSCLTGCDRGYYGQRCEKGNFVLSFIEGHEPHELLPYKCCKNILGDR